MFNRPAAAPVRAVISSTRSEGVETPTRVSLTAISPGIKDTQRHLCGRIRGFLTPHRNSFPLVSGSTVLRPPAGRVRGSLYGRLPMRTIFAVFAVFAVVAAGCGGGSGPENVAPAATVQTEITAAPTVPEQPIAIPDPAEFPDPIDGHVHDCPGPDWVKISHHECVLAEGDVDIGADVVAPTPDPSEFPDPVDGHIHECPEGFEKISHDQCVDLAEPMEVSGADPEDDQGQDCPDGLVRASDGECFEFSFKQPVCPRTLSRQVAVVDGVVSLFRPSDTDDDGEPDECLPVRLSAECGDELLAALESGGQQPDIADPDTGELADRCRYTPPSPTSEGDDSLATATPVPDQEHEHDDSLATATPVPEDVADDDRTEWTADPDTGVPVITQVSSQGSTSGLYVTPVDYIPQDDPVVLAAANACTAGIYAWARGEGLSLDGHEDLVVDRCMIHIEQLAPFVEHFGVDWACAVAGIGDLAAAGNVFPNGLRGNWWDCPNIAWDCSDDCDPVEKVRQAAPEEEIGVYAKLMLDAQQTGNRSEIEGAHLVLMSAYFKGQGLPMPVRGS